MIKKKQIEQAASDLMSVEGDVVTCHNDCLHFNSGLVTCPDRMDIQRLIRSWVRGEPG